MGGVVLKRIIRWLVSRAAAHAAKKAVDSSPVLLTPPEFVAWVEPDGQCYLGPQSPESEPVVLIGRAVPDAVGGWRIEQMRELLQ